MNEQAKVQGVVLIPGPAREYLNKRHLIAYRNHREELVTWLTRMGKDPEKLEGYAEHTAKNYAANLDCLYRWVWEQEDGYTTNVTHDHVDEYLRDQVLSDEDYSDSHLYNVKLALKAYFRWRTDVDEWVSDITITNSSSAAQPKDYVTMEERQALREASLEYGTVPA